MTDYGTVLFNVSFQQSQASMNQTDLARYATCTNYHDGVIRQELLLILLLLSVQHQYSEWTFYNPVGWLLERIGKIMTFAAEEIWKNKMPLVWRLFTNKLFQDRQNCKQLRAHILVNFSLGKRAVMFAQTPWSWEKQLRNQLPCRSSSSLTLISTNSWTDL